MPIACKPYPTVLKYQKFVNEKIKLLENAGYISKSVSPWPTPVFKVQRGQNLLNPQKQQLSLALNYSSLYKSSYAAHNGNSLKSYYLLPNTMYLLATLQNFSIFFF